MLYINFTQHISVPSKKRQPLDRKTSDTPPQIPDEPLQHWGHQQAMEGIHRVQQAYHSQRGPFI